MVGIVRFLTDEASILFAPRDVVLEHAFAARPPIGVPSVGGNASPVAAPVGGDAVGLARVVPVRCAVAACT